MTSLRFPYVCTDGGRTAASELAYLPLRLSTSSHAIEVMGLLDTGSTVNVLPFTMGLELGQVWEEQTIPVKLTGNLARVPAFGVLVTAHIGSFPAIDLAFAWTQLRDVPLILGQVNFFMEFDVCFFRSQSAFEVTTRAAA